MLKEKYPIYQEKAASEKESPVKEEIETYEMPDNPKVCKNCKREKKYLYSTFKNREGKIIYMSRFSQKEKNNKPDEKVA